MAGIKHPFSQSSLFSQHRPLSHARAARVLSITILIICLWNTEAASAPSTSASAEASRMLPQWPRRRGDQRAALPPATFSQRFRRHAAVAYPSWNHQLNDLAWPRFRTSSTSRVSTASPEHGSLIAGLPVEDTCRSPHLNQWINPTPRYTGHAPVKRSLRTAGDQDRSASRG